MEVKIDKAAPHLLAPTVDGIINRFNADDTRPEAALSAVVVLQALKAMGVFDPPKAATIPARAAAAFVQPAPGQRPALAGALANRLDAALREPMAEQPRTNLQNDIA